MKQILLLIPLLVMACTSKSSNYVNEVETLDEVYSVLSEVDYSGSAAALTAAQGFIIDIFATDAKFDSDQAIVTETSVPGRYKVMQRFDSKAHDSFNMVYRIWVQKFDNGWEFGNLAIEDASGKRVLTTNGRMKDLEHKKMTRKEAGRVGNVDYTIVKRSAPNYVRVYTKKRLTRDQVLDVYNQLKAEYEIVQFSTSPNPDADDYMAIQYGTVYEYDKDKITKLSNY